MIEAPSLNSDSNTDQPGPRPSRYAIYAVSVMAAAMFLSTFDQAVLPAVAASIQVEFGISDTEIGVLVSAFTVALAVAAMPIGYCIDRWRRRTILGLGLTVWSLATLVTGLTRTFPQMLAIRAVLGIGEATANPVSVSLIGDYFPRRARGRAMSAIVMAVTLGLGVGTIAGGAVGFRLGWRWAFYLAAVPGLLVAVLAFALREPLRGAAEMRGPKVASAHDSGLRAFPRLLRIRSYTAAMAASATVGLAVGALQFIALYLHRRFGLNIAQAGALLGVPMLVGSIVGTPTVGWLLDWRSRRSARAPAEVGLVALVLIALTTPIMFSARSLVVFEPAMLVFACVSAGAIVAPMVLIQSVVIPSLRASAASMGNMIGRLFGFAVGPLIIGAVSDLAYHDLGLSLLMLTPTAALGASAFMAVALANMKREVEAMEESWALKAPPASPMREADRSEAELVHAARHP